MESIVAAFRGIITDLVAPVRAFEFFRLDVSERQALAFNKLVLIFVGAVMNVRFVLYAANRWWQWLRGYGGRVS